jgi:hypothetical protein
MEYEDAITVKEGEKITLMKWGNAFVRLLLYNIIRNNIRWEIIMGLFVVYIPHLITFF